MSLYDTRNYIIIKAAVLSCIQTNPTNFYVLQCYFMLFCSEAILSACYNACTMYLNVAIEHYYKAQSQFIDVQ